MEKEYICKCGKTFTNQHSFAAHCGKCEIHLGRTPTYNIRIKPDATPKNCKYCGKECKNKNSLIQHEIRCKLNPDKIDTSNCWGNKTNKVLWNKGLTKETDERVRKGGETIKNNYKKGLNKVGRPGTLNPSTKLKNK